MDDIPLFIEILKQRLLDTSLQDWHSDVMDNIKLEIYYTYKTEFGLETYLSINMFHKHSIEYTRLRCSSHNLSIEKLRPTHDRVDGNLQVCRDHGVPLYIRNEFLIYIHQYFTYIYYLVIAIQLCKVATYIYHANHRRTVMSSVNMYRK